MLLVRQAGSGLGEVFWPWALPAEVVAVTAVAAAVVVAAFVKVHGHTS